MNEPADRRSLPVSHQRLIAMMQSVTPPPSDGGTPPIPDELLRRLHEQYGMTSPQATQLQAIERDPAGVTTPPPTGDTAALPSRRSGSFWGRLCPQTCPSQIVALAAICLLLGLMVSIVIPRQGDTLELGESRGIEQHTVVVTDYWLTAERTTPPSGLGLPKFIIIQTQPEPPRRGTIIVFDPTHLEARMFRDGTLAGSAKVTDAQESSEWITARRQLLRSVQP